jgi:hypothetical protein
MIRTPHTSSRRFKATLPRLKPNGVQVREYRAAAPHQRLVSTMQDFICLLFGAVLFVRCLVDKYFVVCDRFVANSALAVQWNQKTGFFVCTYPFVQICGSAADPKTRNPGRGCSRGPNAGLRVRGLGGFARRLAINDGRERMFLRQP